MKRHANVATIVAAALLAAVSCASEDALEAPFIEEEERAAEAVEAAADEGPDEIPTGGQSTDLRIITATVEMEVEEFEEAMAAIKDIAREVDGRVASSSSRRDDEGLMSGSVEMKIPARRYEEAMRAVSELGEVRDAQETSQDVSEEYVDLEARLDNARRLETRILGLLEASTGTIEDVLYVEKELAAVREDIERIEGRLRFLKSRIAMSTITVELYEKGARWAGEPTAGHVFGGILDKIGIVFVGSLGVLITFVVAVAPWAVAALLVVLVIVAALRLKRKRRKVSAPAPVTG